MDSPALQCAHLLQTSLKPNDPLKGKPVHSQIIKLGLSFSVYLMNNLVNFYAKAGFVADAHHVFDEMPVRNTSSWNTILSGYAKQGNMEKAHHLLDEIPDRDSVSWTASQMGLFGNAINTFVEMVKDQVSPTQFAITNVLASTDAIQALRTGRKVHYFAVKLGLSGCVPVANSLLNMYAKTGDLIMANVVFDLITYVGMLSACTHAGLVNLCNVLFSTWQAAKEARHDKEAMIKNFRTVRSLIP